MRDYGDGLPIAALASGQGALALIRTSGPSSLDLLAKVFTLPEKLKSAAGNTVIHGWIRVYGSPHECIDEVLVSVYRGPRSYTGEDGADISCHGGSAVVKMILETLHKAGFQDALPGEFTFRAFMNGKLDLTQSESVMELVSAKTGKGLERAVRRLSGDLSGELGEIRNLLVELLSAAELYLDYPEDEISLFPGPPGDEAEIPVPELLPKRGAAEEALNRLALLRASYRRERLYQEGALVVIAGRPNAGKSSLFNALLHEDRSIVTDIPGTTRDWIEAALSLEGIPLRLADTAGLREEALDRAEALGMERSRELLDGADCILYVIDGAAGLTSCDLAFLKKEGFFQNFSFERTAAEKSSFAGRRPKNCKSFGIGPQVRTNRVLQEAQEGDKKILAVWNKADVLRPPPEEALPVLAVSAKTGEGLGGLCAEIVKILNGTPPAEAEDRAGLGTVRQKELADSAFFSLEEALDLADRGEALDIIVQRLKDAANAIGEITGEISTADILEAMFSRFCVGK